MMSKKQLVIFKFLLIFFSSSTILNADLIKPRSDINPDQVIKIQLKGLQVND